MDDREMFVYGGLAGGLFGSTSGATSNDSITTALAMDVPAARSTSVRRVLDFGRLISFVCCGLKPVTAETKWVQLLPIF